MLSRGQTARPFQNTSTPFLFPSFLIEAGYTNIVASRAGAEEGHVFAGFLYFYFQFSNFLFFSSVSFNFAVPQRGIPEQSIRDWAWIPAILARD